MMPRTPPLTVLDSAVEHAAWACGEYLAAVDLVHLWQGSPIAPIAWSEAETAWGHVQQALRALRRLDRPGFAAGVLGLVRREIDAAWLERRVVLPSDADGPGVGRGAC